MKDRVEFIDGPCRGQMNYPKPPRTLIRMDDEFCYHEYERIDPVYVSCARYRYLARLGKPRWAYTAAKPLTQRRIWRFADQRVNVDGANFVRLKSGQLP